MPSIKCRICKFVNDEDAYFCEDCGCLLAEDDELEIAQNAPLDVIFKKNSRFYNGCS